MLLDILRGRLELLIACFQLGAMSVGISLLFGKWPMREIVFYLVMYGVVLFLCIRLATRTKKHTCHKKNNANTHPDLTTMS